MQLHRDSEKEFEEVEIDEKAEDEIRALSRDPMIYRMITHSIAPRSMAARM